MDQKPDLRKTSTGFEQDQNPASRPFPSKLFVEITTLCNLACPMCVKQSADSGIAEGNMSLATFEALEPAFPHLEALILNGIGEPLVHPELATFIRKAKAKMPSTGWVGFQSNGLLIDRIKAKQLVRAGLDRICLSIDSVCPDILRTIRGVNLRKLQDAYQSLREAREADPDSRLQLGAEFVVMRDNLSCLPNTVRWAAEQGAEFVIVSHILPYDRRQLEERAYPPDTDAAVEIFEKAEFSAWKEGIDLRHYKRIWGRTPPPEEARPAMRFVEAMKSEAHKRGVFLHLLRLFERDAELTAKVRRVFEETANIADQTGVRLLLPAALPRQQRQCRFVEQGSAFISWQGDVHPCYFLWHRYRCFIGEWSKIIQPKIFGNVTERSLLKIWNDPDFHRFRRNVLQYGYPYCTSCSVGPCDYAEAENFEQDCYLQTEPCGGCLWAMGILQCLE